jgi:predicted dehydrogenase
MEQAVTMRDAAKARGVRTLLGLQTRYAPIVAYVRDLIAQGFIGTVWSVSLQRANDQATQMPLTPEFREMLEKSDAGHRIMGGHTYDTLAAYVGEFTELQAYAQTQMARIKLTTGEWASMTTNDHFLVQGRLAGGALASVIIKQHSPTFKPFQLEISGSSGALVITGADPNLGERQPGLPFDYELLGTSSLGQPFTPMPIPNTYVHRPAGVAHGPAADVARMYQHFAQAVATGMPVETDFDHGIVRHSQLDAIASAAVSGEIVTIPAI